MESGQPMLKNINVDYFKNKCQTAFSYFKAQESILINSHTNFIDLIEKEYEQNIQNQHFNYDDQFNSIQCGMIQKKDHGQDQKKMN